MAFSFLNFFLSFLNFSVEDFWKFYLLLWLLLFLWSTMAVEFNFHHDKPVYLICSLDYIFKSYIKFTARDIFV